MDKNSEWIVFWITLGFLTIVMLNLLIGVLSDEMAAHLEKKEIENFAEINDIILEIEYLKFHKWTCRKKSVKEQNLDFFVFAKQSEAHQEQEETSQEENFSEERFNQI